MKRVLVSGATGLIGRRLIASLHRDGIAVRTLSRSAARARTGLPSSTECVEWNGRDLPESACEDCSAIVHLAGEPVFAGRLTAARRERILASRVDSTASIARALTSATARSVESFICGSAVGFYGDRGDERLDESAAPGSGFLADVCQRWEDAARTAADRVRVVSLRTGIALAREGGALPRMSLPFRFGLGGPLGSGRQWVPWIHIDDVVSLIRAAIESADWMGPVNAVAPNPVRNADLTRAMADVLRRPAFLRAPSFALRAALGELSEELLGSRRCVPQSALDRAFAFAHPDIQAALAAELR
jgi:hypothetical protein